MGVMARVQLVALSKLQSCSGVQRRRCDMESGGCSFVNSFYEEMMDHRVQGDRADLVIFVASGRVCETQVRFCQCFNLCYLVCQCAIELSGWAEYFSPGALDRRFLFVVRRHDLAPNRN